MFLKKDVQFLLQKYVVQLFEKVSKVRRHFLIRLVAHIQAYFCDPQNSWQRGSNEKTNVVLRHYFPKGLDLSNISQTELDGVDTKLNERPRKTLDFKMPAQQFQQCVASTD